MNILSIFNPYEGSDLYSKLAVDEHSTSRKRESSWKDMAITTELQFNSKIAKVSYRTFLLAMTAEENSSVYDRWIYRKLQAIPMMVANLVQAPFHLLKALFFAVAGNKDDAKESLFSAGRNMQEATGWFVTLFNDSVGLYLVSEAKSMRSFYELKLMHPITSDSPGWKAAREKMEEMFEASPVYKKYAESEEGASVSYSNPNGFRHSSVHHSENLRAYLFQISDIGFYESGEFTFKMDSNFSFELKVKAGKEGLECVYFEKTGGKHFRHMSTKGFIKGGYVSELS